MDIEQLIKDLEAKIEQVKIEGGKMLERVMGESNGRVAELQSTIAMLKERQIMATPVDAIAAAGAVVDAQRVITANAQQTSAAVAQAISGALGD